MFSKQIAIYLQGVKKQTFSSSVKVDIFILFQQWEADLFFNYEKSGNVLETLPIYPFNYIYVD